MASPEPEREREPRGIFVRYATVQDIDEVKSILGRQDTKLDRQDTRMDRQDARMDRQDAKIDGLISDVADIKARQDVQDVKIDTLIAEMAALKARQDALETKMDKHHAHMYRLLYTLLGVAVIALALLARESFF